MYDIGDFFCVSASCMKRRTEQMPLFTWTKWKSYSLPHSSDAGTNFAYILRDFHILAWAWQWRRQRWRRRRLRLMRDLTVRYPFFPGAEFVCDILFFSLVVKIIFSLFHPLIILFSMSHIFMHARVAYVANRFHVQTELAKCVNLRYCTRFSSLSTSLRMCRQRKSDRTEAVSAKRPQQRQQQQQKKMKYSKHKILFNNLIFFALCARARFCVEEVSLYWIIAPASTPVSEWVWLRWKICALQKTILDSFYFSFTRLPALVCRVHFSLFAFIWECGPGADGSRAHTRSRQSHLQWNILMHANPFLK